MENSYKTKNVIFIVLVISIVLLFLIVFAFFCFFRHRENNVDEVVKNGVVTMRYETSSNQFTLSNLTPISDELGKNLREPGRYFDFSVSSEMDSDTSIEYEIALVKDDESTLDDGDVVVYLEKQGAGTYAKVEEPKVFSPIQKKTSLGSPAHSMILDKVTLSSGKEENYRLRLWVREGATVDTNGIYSVKVQVFGKAL